MKADRIKLINCDVDVLKLIIKGNDALASGLNITVPNNWSTLGEVIFNLSLEKITAYPDSMVWWTYLPVHLKTNTLLGCCGFKGEPDDQGMVEIGYEIAEEYRNQGYATELTGLLVKIAFENPRVNGVLAHTLAEENASVRVLKKNNFIFIEEIEDGIVWKWIKK